MYVMFTTFWPGVLAAARITCHFEVLQFATVSLHLLVAMTINITDCLEYFCFLLTLAGSFLFMKNNYSAAIH